MNDLEKKSFYSFLLLYIGSSFLFTVLSGFWYYKASKNSLENTVYYKMQHYADHISGLIINAQMHGTKLNLPELEKGYGYYLVKTGDAKDIKEDYFEKNDQKVLISAAPQEHMDVKYVVIRSKEFGIELKTLRKNVMGIMSVVFVLIVIISWGLSKLFMKPIHQKMVQIEQFVQDISHELNTPITALQMSSSRALQKGVYDEKSLKNISISTKQLYTLYRSLTFLNFETPTESIPTIDLQKVLQEVVEYYAQLCEAKGINVVLRSEQSFLAIEEDKARLFFSNLLSNAIKYSMPHTNITLTLTKNSFVIKDEGVGVAKEKLEKIFDLYVRSSSLAGGFGVGLSIVKKICDEANIKISISSEVDKGTEIELLWS